MNWSRQDTRALIEAAGDVPRISIGAVKTIRRHCAEEHLVERMALFERFIARTNSAPHVWGLSDCSLVLADWAVASGYLDPAAHLRGTYETEAECRALLQDGGGLPAVVGDCAVRIGLKPVQEPLFGSVGVIGAVSNPDRQWSGIWSGHGWMVRWLARDGQPTWARFAARPLAIWRV